MNSKKNIKIKIYSNSTTLFFQDAISSLITSKGYIPIIEQKYFEDIQFLNKENKIFDIVIFQYDLLSLRVFSENGIYENIDEQILNKNFNKIKKELIKINKVSSEDNRSYHISSEKIKKKLSFDNQFNIKDAVKEIVNNFNKNSFKDSLNNEMYFNIKRMKSIKLK